MTPRQHIRYSRLPADEDASENERRQNDYRFDYLPRSYNKIPWKSIFLALFLLFLGSLLLLLAFFILTGHMAGDSSQAYSLLGLGILAFLPGTSKIYKSLYLEGVLQRFIIFSSTPTTPRDVGSQHASSSGSNPTAQPNN